MASELLAGYPLTHLYDGMLGYDPTNPVHVSDHHVRVAVGRDYRDVAPTRGTYVGASSETMTVTVTTKVS